MKTIFLIRHAKSSWDNHQLSDFDRPLNKRGARDAPFMAKMLKGRDVQADLIVSSPANRALTTATYFANEQGIAPSMILQQKEIYEASAASLMKVLHNLPNEVDTVFMFGHNPGFTYLSHQFEGQYIPNIPTCGIVEVKADIDKWADLEESNGKLEAFYFPKQYFS